MVVTQRLRRSRWDRTIIASGDFVPAIRKLKSAPGGNIITFGGIGFASSLLSNDLVDELQLFVNPFLLGNGITIFNGDQRQALSLIQSSVYDCGMVVNRYQPQRCH